MRQFNYVLTSQDAIEGKPICTLSKEAARFASRIEILCGAKSAQLRESAKVRELNLRCGETVTVQVAGVDEEAAVAAMQNYFVANL